MIHGMDWIGVVESEFPEVIFIQTGANLGYTGGNNRGLEYAQAEGADYALILNPDTIVIDPDFVSRMVEHLEEQPQVGIAGPRVYLRERGLLQNTVLYAPASGGTFGTGSSIVSAHID
jgi:GT2 family glycosyltransferase